jgi:hypothetical protein
MMWKQKQNTNKDRKSKRETKKKFWTRRNRICEISKFPEEIQSQI